MMTCQLDVSGLTALCQESTNNWPKVPGILSKYAPTLQMQGVRKQVVITSCLWRFVPWGQSSFCFPIIPVAESGMVDRT